MLLFAFFLRLSCQCVFLVFFFGFSMRAGNCQIWQNIHARQKKVTNREKLVVMMMMMVVVAVRRAFLFLSRHKIDATARKELFVNHLVFPLLLFFFFIFSFSLRFSFSSKKMEITNARCSWRSCEEIQWAKTNTSACLRILLSNWISLSDCLIENRSMILTDNYPKRDNTP